jgi:hypothetical protein
LEDFVKHRILSLAALTLGFVTLNGVGLLFAFDTAGEVSAKIRKLEAGGDSRAARRALEQAAREHPRDVGVATLYAEYLDERRDPAARKAYESLLALPNVEDARKREASRRLAALDLLAGDRAAADRRLSAAGLPPLPPAGTSSRAFPMSTFDIPGPYRSFARMAAISPDLPTTEILAALARNVVTNGYQASSGAESLDQTEYLKLVVRYLAQAREIEKFAGSSRTIRIDNCDSVQTGELLKLLGFRMRGGCGGDLVLETVNASRAFLTMDSGFPLAVLEQALRTNRPFTYDYSPTKVPILYTPEYWLSSRDRSSNEVIDAFINDPALCRLYLGLVKLDPDTAEEVRKAMPVTRIRAFAHVFDFFGGMFRLRDGRVTVPGGAKAAPGWTDLVGVPPDQGVAFVEKLVTKDDGWLASYFDSLSRIQGPPQDYLTEPGRLKRNYAALRGKVTSPGPARPVFRANTDLMLLTTRLRIGPDGKPHVPGNLDVWKQLFIDSPGGKYDQKLSKSASAWKDPDDILEALFGLSRKTVDNEALRLFMALSDMDRRREKPLEPATVVSLARHYRFYGAQYPIFNETPGVTDATILRYLALAEKVDDVRDPVIKADAAGMIQSLTGLWQVFCRHRMIPAARTDESFVAILAPFEQVKDAKLLFDAGRGGVQTLLKFAGSAADANPQERMMDLLAGASSTQDDESLTQLRGDMMRVFEGQRLVSLKTLFDLADHLESLSKGEKLNTALLNRLASRVSDLNLPKSSLSAQEKNSFAFGFWTEKHIDMQRKLNLRSVIDKAAGQPEKLGESRALLTPLLRDTLVGLLYVHYAPPGAQILYTNPLFARSHDFVGISGARQTWKNTEVLGTGWPSSAGGRLIGSLASLPYALAEAEQNFLIPNREQALIWGDLVPQMLVSAKLPRWWSVKPEQIRWVNLNIRAGESMLTESVSNADLRKTTMEILERYAPPGRARKVEQELENGNLPVALENVTPAEEYLLGRAASAAKLNLPGHFLQRIRELESSSGASISDAAISEAFGTPKPTLANSLHPELLYLRTFPTLMGYSSRILAESWESNNLFFAALADELNLSPTQLNVLIPEWTQKTVEQIFATHLEDWPALLRSMRVTADNIRAETRKLQSLETKASLQ